MKHLLTGLIVCLLFSCSNRNDLTAKLLNEKKALTDSAARVQFKQEDYFEKSLTEKSAGADSLTWSAHQDTSFIYDRQAIQIHQRLKAIDFSLDSLSRMK